MYVLCRMQFLSLLLREPGRLPSALWLKDRIFAVVASGDAPRGLRLDRGCWLARLSLGGCSSQKINTTGW